VRFSLAPKNKDEAMIWCFLKLFGTRRLVDVGIKDEKAPLLLAVENHETEAMVNPNTRRIINSNEDLVKILLGNDIDPKDRHSYWLRILRMERSLSSGNCPRLEKSIST
jgi:hypothetical protein